MIEMVVIFFNSTNYPEILRYNDNTLKYKKEASSGTGAQSVIVKLTGCVFDPHSRK